MENVFNKKGRIGNSFKASVTGVSAQVVNLLMTFIYRTCFIEVLSVEYLGINGLFTNILTVLSLAELGIGSAITFRLYAPINENNIEKVAAYMRFYRLIYLIIGSVVAVIGFSLLPFLQHLIKDMSEVPADVNLQLVYSLFILQTLSTYMFSYRGALLTADQNNHVVSLFNIGSNILINAVLIGVLYLSKQYIVVLAVSIALKILSNFILSVYATKKYKTVFSKKSRLEKADKTGLKKDVFGVLCHKIGGVVVGSTDNILLSAFIGVAALGKYSNYSMIILALAGIMSQLFDTFTSSIGNSNQNQEGEAFFKNYKRLHFANLFIVSWVTICLFCLLESFIGVWLDDTMLLGQMTVLVLSASFFLSHMRHINISYTMATGLFKKDKWRPIAESLVNLAASIVLVRYLGIAGIFLGTIISNAALVLWREPILLYKEIFKRPVRHYFIQLAYFFAVTCLICTGVYYINRLMPDSMGFVALKFLVTMIVGAAGLILFTFKSQEFIYYLQLIKRILRSLIQKVFKRKKRDMSMQILAAGLDGVYEIIPAVHGDHRGWFTETFREDEFAKAGISTSFVQDNQSFSAQKGTLRGIHFQNFPYAQSKLVRCIRGEILDIAVDLRSWSPNYKKWVGVVLSAENKKQLFIPKGFGHAFFTLTDDVEVAYKVDDYYNINADRSIKFDDISVGVDWGSEIMPVLSEKDKKAPLLDDSDCNLGARVLVTGVNGQLGHDVVKKLNLKGIENKGVDIADFDLTDKMQVFDFVAAYKPSVIIHCAAYTAVDRAEEDEKLCYDVNVRGTANLAEAAKSLDAKFVYISTEYVYGSEGNKPLKETDKTLPQTVYGDTKLQGENAVKSTLDKHFILRTSWVFGKNGNNFVKTMLKLGKEKDEISVVDDQVGSPTYTCDLAKLIIEMIFTEKYGIYNVSNADFCSWKEFAEEIFLQAGIKTKVNAVTSEEFAAKAKRPKNSRLDKTKLDKNGFDSLPDWKDALKRYLEEIS